MARFVYHNINPRGATEGDCVVRAISLASQIPYETIERKLWQVGDLYDCDGLSKMCYSHFLRDVLGYQEINCDHLTVAEIADRHPNGVYLVRIPNHLTCLIDGTCYDIWDCLDLGATDCWRVR